MNDERRTPQWFFEAVSGVFPFTIDLAASAKNAKLPRFYSLENSAFDCSWKGELAWCNPPYSRKQLKRWIERALSFGDSATVLMLLPADNSTAAGQLALRRAKAILFVGKRLAFDDGASSAKFASWLALFGGTRHHLERFCTLDRDLHLGVVLCKHGMA